MQRFVNTINLDSGDEWLVAWLGEQGVEASPTELDQAREVREALRELLFANNGQRPHGDPAATLNRAALAAELTADFASGDLTPRTSGASGVLGHVLGVTFKAMADGTWSRLKACRNHGCRWAFYDQSRNRSARWCSMQLCGNRTKTRSYRARQRT